MHRYTKQCISALTLLVMIIGYPLQILAADLHTEKMALTNPTVSTATTYTITVSNVTTSPIKCIRVRLTDTLGSDSKPTGMTIPATPTFTGNYVPTPGSWTATGNNTTGVIDLTLAGGETPASSSSRTIVLSSITNGSVANTTYFFEVNTFNNTDCATSPVDTNGKGAYVFVNSVTLSALVNPTLTFTVGSTTCNLGTLSTATEGTCSHTITAATNGTNGYAITYIATTTLTSPASDTITQIGATAAASAVGTEQFGLNLRANGGFLGLAPGGRAFAYLTGAERAQAYDAFGADPVGGSGVVATNYNIPDSFAFTAAGDTIATSSGPSLTTTYTAAYMANIAPLTEAGAYSMVQTYNITANY